MRVNFTDGFDSLAARMDDLCGVAGRGEVGVSAFLSPREVFLVSAYLSKRAQNFVTFGGYGDAERRKVYVLPDYIEGESDIAQVCEYGFSHGISAVEITPSGYRKLTHRDYLGSILALGIERTVVGDIIVDTDGRATVFCDSAMESFICSELCRVANDKVRVAKIEIDSVVIPPRRVAQITDTVASERVDCVVGALCSLSRERAKELVLGGYVEVDYEVEDRPDRSVSGDSLISVRGYGKFRIRSLCDVTRKGRHRLVAEKFL